MPLNRLLDSGQPITPPPDVQHTTLGLDVLGRFVTWDEATVGGTRRFDAVVIGAGMFGGYCAEKIFRFGEANGLKVLVLDAGPFVVPTYVQNSPDVGLNVPGAIDRQPIRVRRASWYGAFPGAATYPSWVMRTASGASRSTGAAGTRAC
jgi:hypothetical protein